MSAFEMLLTVFFSMAGGFLAAGFFEKLHRKEIKIQKEENERGFSEAMDIGEEPGPMSLRNGYGVTRDRNPTFAEQWVNIMNYSGESQTEDGYEEENDNPEGYME